MDTNGESFNYHTECCCVDVAAQVQNPQNVASILPLFHRQHVPATSSTSPLRLRRLCFYRDVFQKCSSPNLVAHVHRSPGIQLWMTRGRCRWHWVYTTPLVWKKNPIIICPKHMMISIMSMIYPLITIMIYGWRK